MQISYDLGCIVDGVGAFYEVDYDWVEIDEHVSGVSLICIFEPDKSLELVLPLSHYMDGRAWEVLEC